MKAKNISYPYPVVGNEDDVPGGVFKPAYFKHVIQRDKILCKAGFVLKNKTLEKLIAKKLAAFTVEVECGSTFFRTLASTFARKTEFKIDANRVREMVGVSFYIRAIAPIPKYLPEGCHPDYKGFSFDINPGDVLGVGGYTSFIAEKEFDPLRPSVSSFITVDAKREEKGTMMVDYSDPEKIIIRLPRVDWEHYKVIKGHKQYFPIFHAALVLPALADAINLVQKGDEETRENYWFKRIEVILQQKKLLDADPLSAAQEVLRYPIERAMTSMAQFNQEDE